MPQFAFRPFPQAVQLHSVHEVPCSCPPYSDDPPTLAMEQNCAICGLQGIDHMNAALKPFIRDQMGRYKQSKRLLRVKQSRNTHHELWAEANMSTMAQLMQKCETDKRWVNGTMEARNMVLDWYMERHEYHSLGRVGRLTLRAWRDRLQVGGRRTDMEFERTVVME